MYTGNVQVVILVSCEGFGGDVKEGVRLGGRAGQSGGIGSSVTLEAMETKEQLRFRFAVIRATAKIRHNRGEVLSGSTRRSPVEVVVEPSETDCFQQEAVEATDLKIKKAK